MFKRFMRSKFIQATIGWLVAAYMVLIKYTTRWTVEIPSATKALMGNGQGLIALTWHSRFMTLNAAWRKDYQMPHVLISRSRDGAIVAYTSQFLGLKVIRGSAKKAAKVDSKGGAAAGHAITRALEGGGCIVITPDGPRGPRQRLKPGAIRLAKMRGAPVVGCIFSVKHRKVFDSWDRFVLPLPFGRGRIIWTEPLWLEAGSDDAAIDAARTSLETQMNANLALADRALGHTATEPAPLQKAAP